MSGVLPQLTEAILVYPNPADQFLTVKYDDYDVGEMNVQIINLLGAIVFSQNFYKEGQAGEWQMAIGNLLPGTYLMKFLLNERVAVKKVVVTH